MTGMPKEPKMRCRLRQVREKAGLSQAQLARAAGTTQMTIWTIERGVHVPNVLLGLRLAEICGYSAKSIFKPLKAGESDDHAIVPRDIHSENCPGSQA